MRPVRWPGPAGSGGSAAVYDVLLSDDPTEFSAATCIEPGDADLTATDVIQPAPGQIRAYLVRARNSCGDSGIGRATTGGERSAPECP